MGNNLLVNIDPKTGRPRIAKKFWVLATAIGLLNLAFVGLVVWALLKFVTGG